VENPQLRIITRKCLEQTQTRKIILQHDIMIIQSKIESDQNHITQLSMHERNNVGDI